jgi:transposase
MQAVTTIGLDIAKSVSRFMALTRDNVVVRRQLKRRQVLAFFEKLPPCLIGLEACASSHYWSRELQALGHTVRLPPAYVKPKGSYKSETLFGFRAGLYRVTGPFCAQVTTGWKA